MKFKSMIAFFCMLTLVFGIFTGCTGKKQAENTDSKPASTETVSDEKKDEQPKAPNFDKKIKFSYGWFNGVKDDDLYNFISKKFNVEIEFVPIGWNERKEQVNVMVASGDMPDVLFYEVDLGQYNDWVKQQAIRNIPDLGEKFPNLQKLKDLMPACEQLTIDGKLYAWPKFKGENKINSLNTCGYIYRKDWADKLGITKDEYTFDEFLEVARQFVTKDPGGNGAGKTIGIGDQDFAFPSMLGAFNVNANAYVKVDGKYVWGATMSQTLEGLRKIKQMYDEKLIWPDFYTAKGYDGNKLYEAGRMGIYYDNWTIGNLNNMRRGFEASNPGKDVMAATTIMKVKGPDGKFWTSEFTNDWSCNIFSPKVDDEKMERILYVMDWLAGEEGSNYCWYGMEGKDWVKEGDKVVLKWEKDSDGKMVPPPYETMKLRNMALLAGDYDYVNPLVSEQTIKDVTDWINARTPEKANISKLDMYLYKLTTPNYLKYNTFFIEYQDQIKKLVVSSKNIESDWNSWLKTMEPKVNEVLKELNGEAK